MTIKPKQLIIALGGLSVAMIAGCASLEERLASSDRQTRFDAEAELIVNAQKQGTDDDRIAAVNRVSTNFEVLRDLAINPKTKEPVALAAVAKLNKDDDLLKVATESVKEQVQMAALKKINDGKALVKIASRPSSANVFTAAIEKINDQKQLGQLAVLVAMSDKCKVVCDKITDQNILRDVAKSVINDQVKIDAINRLDDVNSIKDIALSSKSGKVRIAAVGKLSDGGALVDIALDKLSRTEEKTIKLSDKEIEEAKERMEEQRRKLPKYLRKQVSKDVATTRVEKINIEYFDSEVVNAVIAKVTDEKSQIRMIKAMGQELTAKQLSLIKHKNVSPAVAAAISEIEIAKVMAGIEGAVKSGKDIAPYFDKIFASKNEKLALELCKKFPEQVPPVKAFVAHDMAECVDFLLQNGRTADGCVCLLYAAGETVDKASQKKGEVKKIITMYKETYLLKKFDPDALERANWTLDYKESNAIKERAIKKLMDKYNPLYVAAQKGKQWFVEKYIDDIDLDVKSDDGTPLEIALQNGHLELASYLLKNGAKAPDLTAMMKRAFAEGCEEKVANWLIENKLAKDVAIYAAAIKGVKLDLAKSMQKINAKLVPIGRFADYFVGDQMFEDHEPALKLAEYLLENNVPIDIPEDKYSALGEILWASTKTKGVSAKAKATFVEIAKLLVERGADVNYDVGQLKMVIDKSVDAEIEKESRDHALFPSTIEPCAIKWGMSQSDINLLIQQLDGIESDMNYQMERSFKEQLTGSYSVGKGIRERYAYRIILRAWEKLGKVKYVKEDTTPVMYLAVQENMTELVELMLAKGATVPCVWEKGKEKKDAIDKAQENENKKLVRMLRIAEQERNK